MTDQTKENTLKLTVHLAAFEVMVTGEKKHEYRKRTDWIMSRLWKPKEYINDTIPVYERRTYKYIQVTNGYGSHRPVFIAEFKGFMENVDPFVATYSNGLRVKVEPRDQIIELGQVLEVRNYELKTA